MKLKKKNKIWFLAPLLFASLATVFPIAAKCNPKNTNESGNNSSNPDPGKGDDTGSGQITPDPKKPEEPKKDDNKDPQGGNTQKDESQVTPNETTIRNLDELIKNFETVIKDNKDNLDLKQNVEKLSQKLEEIKNRTNSYKSSTLTKEQNEEAKKFVEETKKVLGTEKKSIEKIKQAIVIKKGFIQRISKIENEIYNSSTWHFINQINLNNEEKEKINVKSIFGYLYAKKIEKLLNIEKIIELQEQLDKDLTEVEKTVDDNKEIIIKKFINYNEEKVQKLEEDIKNDETSINIASDIIDSKKEILNNLKNYLNFIKEKKEIIFYSYSFESIIQIYNEFINLSKESKFAELKNNILLNLENYPPYYSENENKSKESLELQKTVEELRQIENSNIDALKQKITEIFKQYKKNTQIWFTKKIIKNECEDALTNIKKLNITKDSEIYKNNEYVRKNIENIENDIKNTEDFVKTADEKNDVLNKSLELSSNINKWVSRINNSKRYIKVMDLYLNDKWEIFLKNKTNEEIKKINSDLSTTYKKFLIELLNLYEINWQQPNSEFNKKFAEFEQLFNKLSEAIKKIN